MTVAEGVICMAILAIPFAWKLIEIVNLLFAINAKLEAIAKAQPGTTQGDAS